MLSLCIQGTVHKGEAREYTEKMVVPNFELKFREKPLSSCKRQLEKPVSAAAAAKGKSEGKGKDKWEIIYNGRRTVDALEERSLV